LILAGICAADAAVGMTREALFQATVPLTDRSDAAQSAAFQNALKVVLVRVTGRRNADVDPAFAPLEGNARRYVQQYRGTADNQLWVAFDGAAIERWLTQNGEPLWGHERPSTLVLLGIQSGPTAGTVVTAEDTSELKQAIDAAAVLRGLPLIWPDAADVQKDHLDYAALSATPSAALLELARSKGADGLLIGRANNPTAAASVHWTQTFQDRSSEFSGALEGVNRAADLYASLFAASGSLAPIDVEVTGIADLKDYAGVAAYLESLTFISHVGVESLSGDSVIFHLSSRGGVEPLQRALAQGGKLQSVPSTDTGIQRFVLRR
jgi:hypothetical protein